MNNKQIRDYINKRHKYRKRRIYELLILKNGCFDCGIKGPIEIYEFDHTDNSTFKSRKRPNITSMFGPYSLKSII